MDASWDVLGTPFEPVAASGDRLGGLLEASWGLGSFWETSEGVLKASWEETNDGILSCGPFWKFLGAVLDSFSGIFRVFFFVFF